MAYSNDLRERVLALYDEGVKTKRVAQQLRISPAWARRVKQRRYQPPRKIGGSLPKLDASARATLCTWVDQQPDATLDELRGRVKKELGVSLSIGCLWNTLRQMKFTFKKVADCFRAASSGCAGAAPGVLRTVQERAAA